MCQVWCSSIAGIYMRCAKFGVVVLQASILNWGVSLPWIFVHCAIYETYVVSWFCRDLSSIGGGSICHRYMCIVLYIYRYAMRCINFGVAVFKASMLDWRRGDNLPWVFVHCAISKTYQV